MIETLPQACAETDVFLVELAYGEEGSVPASARTHLATCERCQRELHELANVRAAAGALPLEEPSAAMDAAVLAALDEHLAQSSSSTTESAPRERQRLALVASNPAAPAERPTARPAAKPRSWMWSGLAAAASVAVVAGGTLLLQKDQEMVPLAASTGRRSLEPAAKPSPAATLAPAQPTASVPVDKSVGDLVASPRSAPVVPAPPAHAAPAPKAFSQPPATKKSARADVGYLQGAGGLSAFGGLGSGGDGAGARGKGDVAHEKQGLAWSGAQGLIAKPDARPPPPEDHDGAALDEEVSPAGAASAGASVAQPLPAPPPPRPAASPAPVVVAEPAPVVAAPMPALVVVAPAETPPPVAMAARAPPAPPRDAEVLEVQRLEVEKTASKSAEEATRQRASADKGRSSEMRSAGWESLLAAAESALERAQYTDAEVRFRRVLAQPNPPDWVAQRARRGRITALLALGRTADAEREQEALRGRPEVAARKAAKAKTAAPAEDSVAPADAPPAATVIESK